jgi:hypothetical protein
MFFVKITIFWDVMDCSVQPASAIFRIEEWGGATVEAQALPK